MLLGERRSREPGAIPKQPQAHYTNDFGGKSVERVVLGGTICGTSGLELLTAKRISSSIT